MIRVIVIKELKETWLLLAAALFAYAWMLYGVTSWSSAGDTALTGKLLFSWFNSWGIPFVGNGFGVPFAIITGLLATTLGLLQSVRESRQGTYLFLLHRPWPWRAIFLTKLALGGALIFTISALPILIYARWAATPGDVPAPFEWSMTGPTWIIWASLPLVYLGAFLSGLRLGRWQATRLLPLIASIALFIGFNALQSQWEVSVLWLAPLYLLFIGAICFVARDRDYT